MRSLIDIIIIFVSGLYSISAQRISSQKRLNDYCVAYTNPHFITFFNPYAQIGRKVDWQTMLRSLFVRVTINVGSKRWIINNFTIDILGNNTCTIDVYCLFQNQCCQNNLAVNIYSVSVNQYAIQYQSHFFAVISTFPYSSSTGHRFNIYLWQPTSYLNTSSGICVHGCSGNGIDQRIRRDGGDICQKYQDVALSLAEKIGDGDEVGEITQKNGDRTCRFDVEMIRLKDIARDSISLILISAVNEKNPSFEDLSKLIKQAAELNAEGITLAEKRT